MLLGIAQPGNQSTLTRATGGWALQTLGPEKPGTRDNRPRGEADTRCPEKASAETARRGDGEARPGVRHGRVLLPGAAPLAVGMKMFYGETVRWRRLHSP